MYRHTCPSAHDNSVQKGNVGHVHGTELVIQCVLRPEETAGCKYKTLYAVAIDSCALTGYAASVDIVGHAHNMLMLQTLLSLKQSAFQQSAI